MKRIVALISVIVISLGLIACGGTGAAPTLSFDASQLELEMGGFEETDELPMFGSYDLFSAADFDWVSVDEVVDAEADAADAAAEAAGRRVFYVQVMWGQLRPTPHPGLPPTSGTEQASAPTVWDGTITAGTGAAIKVMRLVRFDRDRGVVVNGGPQAIHIQSTTRPHVDGVALAVTAPHHDGVIIQVVAAGDLANDAPVLTFATPEVTATLKLGDLAGLHRLVDTGNANGDQVAFMALRREQPCPAGFVGGRWMRMNERGGRIQGRWVSRTGRLMGHLRGVWGVRSSGEKVLFGKFIDTEGRFVGRLKGTWGEGHFRGVYTAREGSASGVIYGRFRGEDGRGFFRGRWARACAEQAACQCEAAPATDGSGDTRPPCSCNAAGATSGGASAGE